MGDNLATWDSTSIVKGGDGNDTIYIWRGEWYEEANGFNTLAGGSGADKFKFFIEYPTDSNDIITDFTKDLDRIQITANWEMTFSEKGNLTADQFAYGAVATTATHRVLYNQADGALYYDADGSDAGKAVKVATVLNNGIPANLDHTSFEIV